MSAYDSLMSKSRSTKKRRRDNSATVPFSSSKGGSRFFPCPAGCGLHVSEAEVNAHLDNDCPQLNANFSNNDGDGSTKELDAPNKVKKQLTQGERNKTTYKRIESEAAISDNNSISRYTAPAKQKTYTDANQTNNAFQHMMKKSAQVYSNNGSIQQRFHLYDKQGKVSWTCEDDNKDADDNVLAKSVDTKWSATITLKKIKTINLQEAGSSKQQQQPLQERPIQLTVSSSVSPFSSQESPQQSSTTTTQSKFPRLVQRHSRLSISHLKSCLQKSIRRRAPLPAVRVAMELADKSWTDLIRRLPIIILEDSTLHPDFGLLVWLMIADSKGYVPSRELILRVLQVVFEIASCPWQDVIVEQSSEDCSDSLTKKSVESGSDNDNVDSKPTSISLSSSSSTLFPTTHHKVQTIDNAFETTMIRAMLLRAQYGGMKCDVEMLHSFSKTWMQRFNDTHAVPTIIASTCSDAPSSKTDRLKWKCIPSLIHAKARQRSQNLVTITMVNSPGGIATLTTNDVCPAGIDFHCSPVVDHLLSRPEIYSCLCERLTSLLPPNYAMNRDWIASKVKVLIWNYSSGVNRRRSQVGPPKQSDRDSVLKQLWDDVLSSPFDEYAKKFVEDRLQ